MFKRIDHLELLTADPARAVGFHTGRAEIRDPDVNSIERRQWL